jgi:ABC-2 type transport system permease protein
MTRPPLLRLAQVELRKMLDTRAGLWLHVAAAGLVAVVAVLQAVLGAADDHRWHDVFYAALQPAAILLPVAGILLMASEWTQRTALITFTLVPDRRRVLAAKLLAAVAVAVGALVLCLAVSALATLAAGPDVDDTWALPAGLVGQAAVYLGTAMITGVAFGAALLSSAPAIVAYFVLPLAWAAAGTLSALEGAAGWLDTTRTLDPMIERLFDGGDWARAAATLALWTLVPLAIGAWRVLRGEVRVG